MPLYESDRTGLTGAVCKQIPQSKRKRKGETLMRNKSPLGFVRGFLRQWQKELSQHQAKRGAKLSHY